MGSKDEKDGFCSGGKEKEEGEERNGERGRRQRELERARAGGPARG